MRINVPPNPDDLIKLWKAIIAKHTADGAASKLNALDPVKLAALIANGIVADTNNTNGKDFSRKAEKCNQDRDVALGQTGVLTDGTVRFGVTQVRDLLLVSLKGHEQTLGDWVSPWTHLRKPNRRLRRKLVCKKSRTRGNIRVLLFQQRNNSTF
jgi:hypothetical protein